MKKFSLYWGKNCGQEYGRMVLSCATKREAVREARAILRGNVTPGDFGGFTLREEGGDFFLDAFLNRCGGGNGRWVKL